MVTFLKISCKSVQPFSRNVADKETNKETKKEITRKQYLITNITNLVTLPNHAHLWAIMYMNLLYSSLLRFVT